jgi:hypothetical protein
VAIAGARADEDAWAVWALAAALITFGDFLFRRLTSRRDSASRFLAELHSR